VAARHKHKMLVAYVGGAASEEDFKWIECGLDACWSTRVRAPRRGEASPCGRGTERGDGEGVSCAVGVEESWWRLQFDNGVTIHVSMCVCAVRAVVCVCVCVCVCA
jgi:heme A synthase